jgi:hypothetical protein
MWSLRASAAILPTTALRHGALNGPWFGVALLVVTVLAMGAISFWLFIRVATRVAERPWSEAPPLSEADTAAVRRWVLPLAGLGFLSWIVIPIVGSAENLPSEKILVLMVLAVSLFTLLLWLCTPLRRLKRLRNVRLWWVALVLANGSAVLENNPATDSVALVITVLCLYFSFRWLAKYRA